MQILNSLVLRRKTETEARVGTVVRRTTNVAMVDADVTTIVPIDKPRLDEEEATTMMAVDRATAIVLVVARDLPVMEDTTRVLTDVGALVLIAVMLLKVI